MMAASRETIRQWFSDGKAMNAQWMIVVCDTFDYEDYPVYVDNKEQFFDQYDRINENITMQRVMEVYDLNMDVITQLDEHRTFHMPARI